MRSRHVRSRPALSEPAAHLAGQQTIEIDGQRCLVVEVETQFVAPTLPQNDDCPRGYRVAGGLRLGDRSFAVLCSNRTGPDDGAADAVPALTDLLTERELQIAALVSRGKVNKQIAYQLRISEYTVSTHLRRIFSKLGVSSRAAMVAQLLVDAPIAKVGAPALEAVTRGHSRRDPPDAKELDSRAMMAEQAES